jgi:hypothetical protein
MTAVIDATTSPSYLRRATGWLATTTLIYFFMNGAQIFETAAVVPSWTAAPPESLVVFHGPRPLDFKVFWIVLHTVHELTFLAAVAATWRLPVVRNRLLALLAVHVAVRVWTVAYFAPTIIAFQQLPPAAGVDPDLAARAATWEDLNLVRVAIFLLVSFALLPVVATVARASVRAGVSTGVGGLL